MVSSYRSPEENARTAAAEQERQRQIATRSERLRSEIAHHRRQYNSFRDLERQNRNYAADASVQAQRNGALGQLIVGNDVNYFNRQAENYAEKAEGIQDEMRTLEKRLQDVANGIFADDEPAYTPLPSPPPTPSSPPQTQPKKRGWFGLEWYVTGVSSSDSLTLRKGPGQEYPKVGEIPSTATGIIVIGPAYRNGRDDWMNVEWNGASGYANGKYLRKQAK